jgi:Rrf2 family protein
MVDVALNSDAGAISRQEIADRQAISADYVAQLFRRLRRAGIVHGVRGPGGGYVMGRDAAAVTAGDVLRAVEGPVAVVHCVEPADVPSCDRAGSCVTHLVWRRLTAVMTDYLDSVTLQDLCEEAAQLQAKTSGGEPGGEGVDLPKEEA